MSEVEGQIEDGGFTAQNGSWNIAKTGMFEDIGATPNEGGNSVRMHKEKFLGSWLGEDTEENRPEGEWGRDSVGRRVGSVREPVAGRLCGWWVSESWVLWRGFGDDGSHRGKCLCSCRSEFLFGVRRRLPFLVLPLFLFTRSLCRRTFLSLSAGQ